MNSFFFFFVLSFDLTLSFCVCLLVCLNKKKNANEMRRCTHSRISRVTVDSISQYILDGYFQLIVYCCARVCICQFCTDFNNTFTL